MLDILCDPYNVKKTSISILELLLSSLHLLFVYKIDFMNLCHFYEKSDDTYKMTQNF